MIDVTDLDTARRFWGALLGLETAYATEHYVYLAPAPGQDVNLAFQRVDEGRAAKNRVHPDFHVDDLDAATRRAIGLGATTDGDVQVVGPYSWRVLHDPLGNEFCLVAGAPT